MISNGFQARLLKDGLVSIEETFAITPACSLFEGKDGSSATSASDILPEQQLKLATFPSISVDCYSPTMRPKALSVVRRGAVFVTPRSTATATATGSTTASPAAVDETVPANVDPIGTDQASKLFLAFRWVGAEHSNAQSANVLGDIGKASLQRMTGVDLEDPVIGNTMQEEEGEDREEEAEVEEVLDSSPASSSPVQESSSKSPQAKHTKRKFLPSLLLRKKKAAKQDTMVISSPVEKRFPATESEHPILAQVYLDNQLLTLVAEEGEASSAVPDKLLATVQLRGGALLDLKDIGSAMPDAATNEILHTVTVHLWDATRKDIGVDKSFKPGQQIEWSPKKTVVPNVIFHFEIVSSGPSGTEEVTTPSGQISSTTAALPSPPHDTSSSESAIPSYPNTSPGRLASVAEEDSFRTVDEAILADNPAQASRHAKMRKAASIAVSALRPKQRMAVLATLGNDQDKGKAKDSSESQVADSSEGVEHEVAQAPKESPEKIDDKEVNMSVMKTLVRKVKFKRPSSSSSTKEEDVESGVSEGIKTAILAKLVPSKSKKEENSLPEVIKIKIDGPQSYDTPPRRTSLHFASNPLKRSSSTGSNRFNKMLGRKAIEAKKASLLGTDTAQHEEICQTLQKVEILKREHVLIEKERKVLEEQWSKALLKTLDEDVTMLEKRVEEGKREVDLLRRRVWPAPN